jgi:excinuclease ABC subunit B
MQRTIEETDRRINIQRRYNEEHNITPETVRTSIKDIMTSVYEQDYVTIEVRTAEPVKEYNSLQDLRRDIKKLEKEMQEAARVLAFEEAAGLRDKIKELREFELEIM